jgi:precorrin-3B methylase
MGKLFVVGLVAGLIDDMTGRAVKALEAADLILAIRKTLAGQAVFSAQAVSCTGMTWIDRCVQNRRCEDADGGNVSSGEQEFTAWRGSSMNWLPMSEFEIEVIQVSRGTERRSVLGAPLIRLGDSLIIRPSGELGDE